MSPHPAIRLNGVCLGALWKQHSSAAAPPKIVEFSSDGNERSKSHDYCMLLGHTLFTYPDINAFNRGDHAMSEVRIVGASSWKPVGTSGDGGGSSSSDKSPPTFLLVTYAGTHIYCSAPSTADRDIWLSALHSGLEASYALFHETLSSTSSVTTASSLSDDNRRLLAPPPPATAPYRFGIGRRRMTGASGAISSKHCVSCGQYPPESLYRHSSAPLPQYGIESRADLCADCLTAQGLLSHMTALCALYCSHAHERAALQAARDAAVQAVQRAVEEEKTTPPLPPEFQFGNDLGGSWTAVVDPEPKEASYVHVSPADAGSKALVALINTPGFATFRRRSRALEVACGKLERGTLGGAVEFLDMLAESERISINGLGDFGGDDDNLELKKEAFKVGGDMSAAIKLLSEHALPEKRGSVEMLSCILEFLLELCEDGESGSVAFFWPQLRHIHLRMLPAKDADALVRVELVEDFLLTVSVKYSVHLALELVWGLVADLEEAMDEDATPKCRARRWAVLRFVCELESVVFDYAGGWGGGNVSLKGVLKPSPHQEILIQEQMSVLGLHRRFSGHHLSKSIRVDRLQKEADAPKDKPISIPKPEESPQNITNIEDPSQYYTAHLSFIRRLGDIAEKLRHMEVEKREAALKRELEFINTGKRYGGDPLSRVGEGISKVTSIPSNEGHVFRSKERTPVLLLMEVLRCVDKNASPHPIRIEREEVEGLMDQLSNDHSSGDKVKEVMGQLIETKISDDKIRTLMNELNEETKTIDNEGDRELIMDFIGRASITELSEGAADDEDAVRIRSPKPVRKLKKFDSPTASTPTITTSELSLVSSTIQRRASIDILTPPYIEDHDALFAGTNDSATPNSKTNSRGRNNRNKSSRRVSNLSEPENKSKPMFDEYGEGRREVLTTILARGMRGSFIAKKASAAAQRAVQAMDRQRAVEMMNENDEPSPIPVDQQLEQDFAPRAPQPQHYVHEDHQDDEENEAIDALRLLLLQNRVAQQVAQGKLTPENAQRALAPVQFGSHFDPMNGADLRIAPEFDSSVLRVSFEDATAFEEVISDAGEVDSRLAGCGPLSPAILNALRLWKSGIVSNGELLELVQKDLQYLKQTTHGDASKLIEDSAFWVRFAFGERWAEKKARVAATSPNGTKPGWDLIGVIVKSNDDLRQEAFVMQLIELCQEAFEIAGLELWVNSYRIIATGRTTGIIECLHNALSFDSLKKRPGYGKGGLRGHFERMTEFDTNPREAFETAQRNFVRSLAAYSLMSYLFLFKDRHNGNLLLDTAGHIIHIDFGFVFGIAPGGSFSLEMSAPFKLTEEMLDVMGGIGSPLFSEFVTLFCCGFLAVQAHVETFCTIVEVTCKDSTYKCFEGKDSSEIIDKLRQRFKADLDKASTVVFALDLIKQATTSYGTKQYDFFQYMSQGIAT